MHITTLPLEIIDMILSLISHTGDDPDSGRLSWETRRALRACSFISHLWLSECRKRLFRTIPAPYDDASLHAFKRIFASRELTFGTGHVKALGVVGRAPAVWGWHWWRTHARGVARGGGGAGGGDDGGAGKKRGNEVDVVDVNRIFAKFFDWVLDDAAAGRTFRSLGELRFLEVAFEAGAGAGEDRAEEVGEQLEWAVVSPRTRETLHRSFPSLTKLVLKRTRFADEALFVSLMESFGRTLEVLDMDCVAIDGLEHREAITEPRDGRRKEALLPALRALRLTGIAINLAIFLIPSPKLRNVMFDIPDDDIRREVPLRMLVDLVASAHNLQSLSLHNRCSGSFRDADIQTDGNPLSQLVAKAPTIEHLTIDIRSSLRPYLITLLSQTPNSNLTSLYIPDLQSLLVDLATLDETIRDTFPSIRVLKFNCRVIVSSMAARRKKLSIPMPPLPSSSTGTGGAGGGAQQMSVSPYVPFSMVNMLNDDDETAVVEDDEEEEGGEVVAGASSRTSFHHAHAHARDADDDEDEDDRFPSLMAALSEDTPTFANLRMRLRQMDDADEVEEMLRKMKREEEEVAVKMREERSRVVFRKFARKLPWCEERGCLRPVFQFDG
ncbi:hypothetical protein PQX77_000991 [Marasmius sp. AFHP31]|nr:hypothetical protein PQX77_000991 [Marasmius sp. AFHP31]